MPTVRFDSTQLRRIAAAVADVDGSVQQHLASGVAKAGNLVSNAAKANASFSRQIPPSIRSKASGNTATISAGNASVPIAALFERPTGWRHPLFGNRKHWYSEGPRQYLHPALDDNADQIETIISDEVTEALTEVFDGS